MPQHLKEENYEPDTSSSSEDEECKETEPVVYPEAKVQIKLTTPMETEHDLLLSSTFSQSAPASPVSKRRQIPVMATNSSESEESDDAEPKVMRQRSQSVEILSSQVDCEHEKQTDQIPTQSTRNRTFTRFKTSIANRLKSKNRFFGDSVTPSIPHESEEPKISPISTFKKTVTSLKERTQKVAKSKRKSKTTIISI